MILKIYYKYKNRLNTRFLEHQALLSEQTFIQREKKCVTWHIEDDKIKDSADWKNFLVFAEMNDLRLEKIPDNLIEILLIYRTLYAEMGYYETGNAFRDLLIDFIGEEKK